MNKGGSGDKSFIKMNGVFHEIYEDKDRDIYINKVIEWMKSRHISNNSYPLSSEEVMYCVYIYVCIYQVFMYVYI